MSKNKWVEPPKFKPGLITITPENEEQHGLEKGTLQYIQETFFGKTEDAEFEVILDEQLNDKIEWDNLPKDNEAPTLLLNIEDEAGLWDKNKQ